MHGPTDISGDPLGGLATRLGEHQVIGEIIDVSGGECACEFTDEARFNAMAQGGLDYAVTGHMGSFIKVAVGDRWVFGVVRALRASSSGENGKLYADIDFIGESTPSPLSENGYIFQRGITRYPMPGQKFVACSLYDVQNIFSPQGRPHINIGAIYPTEVLQASLLINPLLAKHFAVLGATGTGKSSTVALLIHQLVEQAPHAHVLILDPHNEYGAAFPDNGRAFDTDNINIPFWLMNLEEHIEVFVGQNNPERELEADILKRTLLAARRKGKPQHILQRLTVDTPVPYLLSDLLSEIQRNMGKLDKPERLSPYLRLKSKIEEMKADSRYAFMFSNLTIQDEMPAILAKLLRFPTEGRPVSILDLSGVPSDIVNVVVSVLARLVFDFALWSRKEANHPVLLVCEEAHRYVPEDTSQGFSAAKRILDRIAKEGRKYGVSLGLVSQRPADISESVLSQCGTMIALRMNNERDQHFVERALPEGARGFLDALPALRNRECLVVGEGIAAPSRVILNSLEEHKRPASADPEFAHAWQGSEAEPDFIARVVKRWRGAAR